MQPSAVGKWELRKVSGYPIENSIFTAEMTAINRVLEYLKTTTTVQEVVIFTDSLSAVQAIEAGESKARPNLTIEIINNLDEAGEERDSIVKFIGSPVMSAWKETRRQTHWPKKQPPMASVDLQVNPELQDAYADIENRVNEIWQTGWDDETKGRHYHAIEPNVDGKVKYREKDNRRKETLITRPPTGKVPTETLSVPDGDRARWQLAASVIARRPFNTG